MASDDIGDALERVRAATADIRRQTAQVSDRLAAAKRGGADEAGKVEKQRRAGEHGRAWQVLQERIDTKRTTLGDILNGVDLSDEATAVRRDIQKNIPLVREGFENFIGGEDEQQAVRDIRSSQAELARTIDELRDLTSRL